MTAMMSAQTVHNGAKLIGPLAIGGVVAIGLGAFGKLHEPSFIAVSLAGFSGPLTVKVWLTTLAAVMAVVQVLSAMAMYGRLPGVTAGAWTDTLHRWSGRVAFLFAVPVAVHCLYALGFQTYDARVLAHSVLGCVFFGAFTTKMLTLPKRGLAGWVLPLLGGVVFTLLIALWFTSSVWFFTTTGVQL